jgi:hypothetical protein
LEKFRFGQINLRIGFGFQVRARRGGGPASLSAGGMRSMSVQGAAAEAASAATTPKGPGKKLFDCFSFKNRLLVNASS